MIVPDIDGKNVTVKVHLAAAASAPPQGVAPPARALKFPLAEMLLMESEVAPELVTVTVVAALVTPTGVPAKLMLAGRNFKGAVAPAVPLPESVISCGLNAPA